MLSMKGFLLTSSYVVVASAADIYLPVVVAWPIFLAILFHRMISAALRWSVITR